MKNISGKRKVNGKMMVLCSLIVLASIISNPIIGVGTVNAQENTIENALSSYGLEEPKVSISANEVIIEYKQRVSKFGTLDEEFRKIADILVIIADELSPTYLVKIHQHFDDGHIMEIIGKPEDGKAFFTNQITVESFSEKLEFKPLTRGPLIVPGVCESDKGENCENYEACACYPNENCGPENPEANEKGCVVVHIPANSHFVGSEYVCDEGYEWSADLTNCVPEKKCPQNAFKFQGDCYCNLGYEWDSDRVECILREETTNTPPTASFSIMPQNPTPDDTIVGVSASSDPDGDVLTYSWYFDGEYDENLGNLPEWAWPNPQAGEYNIRLVVEDGEGGSDEYTVAVTVVGGEWLGNRPPTASFSIMPENPEVGDYIVVASTSSDPDGDTLTYSWYVDGVSRFGNSPNWEWESPEAGEHTIKLVVEDSEGGSDEHLMEMNVRKGLPPQQLPPIPLLLFGTGGVAGLAFLLFFLVRRRQPVPVAPPVTQPEEFVSRRPPARPEGPPERLGGGKPSGPPETLD